MFAQKLAGVRKEMAKYGCELDVVDPPTPIRNQPFFILGPNGAAEWKNLQEKGIACCWWDYEAGEYHGFESALAHILKYIKKNGPYDGILGFSQGAAMSAIVASMVDFKVALLFLPFCFTVPSEDLVDLPTFDDDFEAYKQRVSLNPKYEKYFQFGHTKTRFVCVYSVEDGVIPPLRTQFFNTLLPRASIHMHEAGHRIPRDVTAIVADAVGKESRI